MRRPFCFSANVTVSGSSTQISAGDAQQAVAAAPAFSQAPPLEDSGKYISNILIF